MFLDLSKIFLDSQEIFTEDGKNWIFHQNNILQYFFSKSVHDYLTTPCVKYG